MTDKEIVDTYKNALEIIAQGTLSENDMQIVAQVVLDMTNGGEKNNNE